MGVSIPVIAVGVIGIGVEVGFSFVGIGVEVGFSFVGIGVAVGFSLSPEPQAEEAAMSKDIAKNRNTLCFVAER
jgi:hypothetical protein